MKQKQKNPLVLLTGGAGYVGSNLIRELLIYGYNVRCLDLLVYGGKTIIGLMNHPGFELIKGDIRKRKVIEPALEGVDIIIHLAAIVGDKPCQTIPEISYQINFMGTALLADLAKKRGIQRFVMASTCSNYGIADTAIPATEDRQLNPVSLYAETKIDCENYLLGISDNNFQPTILRFATAYGVSFRTRFDLLVNSFAYEGITENKISVFGAKTWRPYIHVQDMAEIILGIITAPLSKVGKEIFNAGSNSENFQKWEVVEILKTIMPSLETHYADGIDDKRSYRVDFTKLENLKIFKPTRYIKNGFAEIIFCFDNGILTKHDYESNKLDGLVELFKTKKDILINV